METGFAARDAQQLLLAFRAHGHDETTTRGKLLNQGIRQGQRRSRCEDAIKGTLRRPALHPVPMAKAHVARNVRFRHGDGMKGWPTQGPFDGILAAAAPLTLPDALVEQLAPGGRLVVPVGPEGEQQLLRITRRESGLHKEMLGPVAFVPLLGGIL